MVYSFTHKRIQYYLEQQKLFAGDKDPEHRRSSSRFPADYILLDMCWTGEKKVEKTSGFFFFIIF
jgi:hypothetical protein